MHIYIIGEVFKVQKCYHCILKLINLFLFYFYFCTYYFSFPFYHMVFFSGKMTLPNLVPSYFFPSVFLFIWFVFIFISNNLLLTENNKTSLRLRLILDQTNTFISRAENQLISKNMGSRLKNPENRPTQHVESWERHRCNRHILQNKILPLPLKSGAGYVR